MEEISDGMEFCEGCTKGTIDPRGEFEICLTVDEWRKKYGREWIKSQWDPTKGFHKLFWYCGITGSRFREIPITGNNDMENRE